MLIKTAKRTKSQNFSKVGRPSRLSLDLFRFERRIIGTYSGALSEQEAVFTLIASGRLNPTPLVSHTMPLDDFALGYSLAKSCQALKILFTPSRAASS